VFRRDEPELVPKQFVYVQPLDIAGQRDQGDIETPGAQALEQSVRETSRR
jgi:hypothetical protein